MGSSASKTPRPDTASSSQASIYQDQTITLDRNGVPLPRPTRTKKRELIGDFDFEVFDECATEAPMDLLLGTFWQVVEYLVITPNEDLLEEMMRIRILFRWVTSFDIYNMESELIPPPDSPLEYFMKIQCGMGNHAELLYILCQLADIPCVVINGLTKSGSYEIGGKMNKEEMGSQWNAVFIKGQWRFIDVFWSIYCADGNDDPLYILVDSNGGFTRFCEGDEKPLAINEFYFFTDPDAFIWTHIPYDKEWQLLRVPIEVEEFEKRLYVREMFTKMQMSIKDKTKMSCKLVTEGKPIGLDFTLPEERSENFKFMYTLFQSRTEIDTDKRVDIYLERFVGFEHTQDNIRFVLRFPFTGTFQMDIFGCDLEVSDSFELICTYIIECTAVMDDCLPFPDCPTIGWGPNPHAEKHGLFTITPKDSCFQTDNGEAEIRIKVSKNYHLCHSLKSLQHDDAALSRYSLSKLDRNEYVVNIRLPKPGEYALKIYANIQENGKVSEETNILNFLVMCKSEFICNSPFPDIIGNHLGLKPGAESVKVFPLSNPSGFIKGWDGKARLEFEIKDPGIKLFCEMFSAKRIANSRMSVTNRVEEGVWMFNVDMPIKGEYSLNVFATQDNNPDTIYDVYSCLINSTGYSSKRVKFDDDDAVDEMPTRSIHTSDTKVQIPLQHNGKPLFIGVRRRNAKDFQDGDSVNYKIDKKESSLEITIKEFGEYLVDVFGRDDQDNMHGMGRYIIERRDSHDTYHEDIKALMAMLKPEVDTNDDESEVVETIDEEIDEIQTISEHENIDDNIYDYEEVSESVLDKIIDENSNDEENNNEDTSNEEDVEYDEEKIDGNEKVEDDVPPMSEEQTTSESVEDTKEEKDAKLLLVLEPITEVENENGTNEAENNNEDEDVEQSHGTEYEVKAGRLFRDKHTPRLSVAESDDGGEDSIMETMTPKQKKKYTQEVRQRRTERNIKKAMKRNDLQTLLVNLHIYKSVTPAGGDTLQAEADRLVALLRAKQSLIAACKSRKRRLLARAIKRARSVNYERRLDVQIMIAMRVLNRLNRITRISEKVLELNQNVLTEMKNYHKPPLGVHQVLVATSLLLGDDAMEMKEWSTCKKFLYKTGKDNILRRISQFDPRTVDREVVCTAKSLIGSFTMVEIRDVSRGAAVFYMWVKGMVDVIESYYDTNSRKASSMGSRPALPRASSMYKIRSRTPSTVVRRI